MRRRLLITGASGQLGSAIVETFADCDLTFRDVDLIRDVFLSILRGMYHPRISYADAPPPEPLTMISGNCCLTELLFRRQDTEHDSCAQDTIAVSVVDDNVIMLGGNTLSIDSLDG